MTYEVTRQSVKPAAHRRRIDRLSLLHRALLRTDVARPFFYVFIQSPDDIQKIFVAAYRVKPKVIRRYRHSYYNIHIKLSTSQSVT